MARVFAEDVFSFEKLEATLPAQIFHGFRKAVEQRTKLEPEIAEAIACEIKKWALNRGVTHYAHWFLPLTGLAAGKQNSFLERDGNGRFIENFSAQDLIRGEPDASSFPHGGMRSTFEARGYTFWDISSPVFIRRNSKSSVLYIPSLFFSFDGKVLDKKTPLLRSLDLINQKAVELLRQLGINAEKVLNMIGPEQEFFLVREDDYRKRPDLFTLGRVLFAAPPPRGQQMGDHYFGIIPEMVQNFLDDLEEETFRLGIPIKTRHNEVAPNQFEVAPYYENAAVAVDHNQLLMEVLTTLARKHRLVCLLHEKPFSFFNGSGKHLNWSLQTESGWNLFSTGKNEREKKVFLAFLAAFLKGIFLHHDLLQAAFISDGNELRLGGHEAPPAIISVYLGEQLEKYLRYPEKFLKDNPEEFKVIIKDQCLPVNRCDLADRNRTSPVAFTGNKFEFRMPGASASLAFPLAAINIAVADGISMVIDKIKGSKSEAEQLKALKKLFAESLPIVFNGDNYSNDWRKEAQRRKLFAAEDFYQTVKNLSSEKNIKLFEKYQLLTGEELKARTRIKLELYWKTVQMELEVARYLLRAYIIPSAVSNQKDLLFCLQQTKDLFQDHSFLKNGEKFIFKFSQKIASLMDALSRLDLLNEKLKALSDDAERAEYCSREIRNELFTLQKDISRVEERVARNLWMLPNMAEMLFRY